MTEAASFSPTQAPPADPTRTVFFGIPLKARVTARDWTTTVRDFNRTLASIYNQTIPHFGILVGCHDVPALYFPTDERLEFIGVFGPRPNAEQDSRSQIADRTQKLHAIAQRFKRSEGRWYMTVQAGDLISARVVEFVLTTPNPHGYIAQQGYVLDSKRTIPETDTSATFVPHGFDQICRTNAVLRFHSPDVANAPEESTSLFVRLVCEVDHRQIRQNSLDAKKPLTPFPFPAVAHRSASVERSGPSEGPYRRDQISGASQPQPASPRGVQYSEFALDHPIWNAKPLEATRFLRLKEELKVSFLVCGAMKSGTTSLARYIQLHPSVGSGRRKELHYFDNDDFFPPNGPDYSLYHMQFARSEHTQIYGEATPAYMYLPKAVERIHNYNSSMKLICILRNPIERAFSHYQAAVREDRENLTFRDAVLTEMKRHREAAPRRDRQHAYIDRGFYSEQIRNLWRLFPEQQTLFLRTDDLHSDPQTTMNSVFGFLELDSVHVPHSIRSNEGKYSSQLGEEDKQLLTATFEFEIKTLERMLGWNCSAWFS